MNLRLEHDAETQARIAWEQSEARRADLEALRIAVAERVCGYAACEEGVWLTPEHIQNGDPYEAFTVLDELPHYSTDLNHCQTAELRLIELGLGRKYARNLQEAIRSLLIEQNSWDSGWELALLTAPAEARCRAMLSVLEGV